MLKESKDEIDERIVKCGGAPKCFSYPKNAVPCMLTVCCCSLNAGNTMLEMQEIKGET